MTLSPIQETYTRDIQSAIERYIGINRGKTIIMRLRVINSGSGMQRVQLIPFGGVNKYIVKDNPGWPFGSVDGGLLSTYTIEGYLEDITPRNVGVDGERETINKLLRTLSRPLG